jgi:hypothetical protein
MPSFAIGEGTKRRVVTLALEGVALLTEHRRGEKAEKPESETFGTPEEAARELRQRIAALIVDGYHEVAEVAIGASTPRTRLDPAEAEAELAKLIDETRGDEEALAPGRVLEAWHAFGKLPIDCQGQAFEFEYSIGGEHVTVDLSVDCQDAGGLVRINCELHFPAEEELLELDPEAFTLEGSNADAFLDKVADTEVWQALSRFEATEVTVESWRVD